MSNVEADFSQKSRMKTQKLFILTQVLLRVVTIAATLASAWIMLTNKQSMEMAGFVLEARYTYSPEFKFLVYATLIAGGFSFLSLLFLLLVGRQSSNPVHYFQLFLHDLVMLCLVLAGCGAATAIGLLARNGNDHTGWMPICDHFDKYCKKGTISLALAYVSLVCLLMLTVISAAKSRQIQV